jgi:hypothetical protein
MTFTVQHAKEINSSVRRFFKAGLKSSNKSYDIDSILEMKDGAEIVVQRETGNKTYAKEALMIKWHKRDIKNPESQSWRPPKDLSRKDSVEWLLTVAPLTTTRSREEARAHQPAQMPRRAAQDGCCLLDGEQSDVNEPRTGRTVPTRG